MIALLWLALTHQSLSVAVVGVCLGLLSLISWMVQRPAQQQSGADADAGDKMISMVAFFETLPFVDEAILTSHVNRAWGLEMQNDELAESFVVGTAPLFVLKTPHQMYVVNYLNSNYFDNLEEVLDEVTEMRLSNAIQSHRGWISVDLIWDTQNLDSSQHYAMIGQLLREMTNEDCVALLLPDRMKLVPWDDSVERALLSEDPVANLFITQPPVIPIDDNHPKLIAAVTMARGRFSQFVAAFENHQRNEDRNERDHFAVKAPIAIGSRTEFMWITTTAIENGVLYGILDNRPVGLTCLRRGDRVRVPVSKLNDWIFTRGDRTYGGFTTRVIAEWARDQKRLQLKQI